MLSKDKIVKNRRAQVSVMTGVCAGLEESWGIMDGQC
jgi:phage shock protein PspC (stress-responsive transcriptional regulator)